MYKRPVPRPTFAVDHSTLKLARVEDSIVHKLTHIQPFPPYKPLPYAPVLQLDSLIFGLKRHHGLTDEEAEEIRRKNYIAPVVAQKKKTKKTKKRVVHDTDIDKVFSQFAAKPAVKKKVLKAVVKKI